MSLDGAWFHALNILITHNVAVSHNLLRWEQVFLDPALDGAFTDSALGGYLTGGVFGICG
jgi:hypothetical protein